MLCQRERAHTPWQMWQLSFKLVQGSWRTAKINRPTTTTTTKKHNAYLTPRDSPENVFVCFSGSVHMQPVEHGKVHSSGFCHLWRSVLSPHHECIGAPLRGHWRVLDLQVRVQTVRRSSFSPFIQAAVPWSLTKAPLHNSSHWVTSLWKY